jgi:hypothetical protein
VAKTRPACECSIATVVLALALTAVVPAIGRAQDITLKQTTTTTTTGGAPIPGPAGPRTDTLYVSPSAIRHVSPGGGDLIVRFDQQRSITLDHAQKTYTAVTFDEMQKMMDQAANAAKQMDPKQAEAMRQAMGAPLGEVKVTKLGPGETIAGYATEKYEVSMPPMLTIEMHAAPALPLPPAYYNAMKLRTPATAMLDVGKMYEEMKKIPGLVLKQVSTMKIMNTVATTTTVTTSVDRVSLPASTFDPPAGYQAVPLKP